MTAPLLLLLILSFCFSPFAHAHHLLTPSSVQASDYEITELLAKLSTKKIKEPSGIRYEGPSAETQKHVPERLLEIAGRSPEARRNIIDRLIRVLEDPATKEEPMLHHHWVTAVGVLKELKAIEAIDVFIENLDQPDPFDNGISLHYRPVVRAIVEIGQPAVPKLIAALSHPKPTIRREAIAALDQIGGEEAAKAITQASLQETEEEVLEILRAISRNTSEKSDVQVSREASSEVCADGQTVAISFQFWRENSVPSNFDVACTQAPVGIKQMQVMEDGTLSISFRNSDLRRRIAGISYMIFTLNSDDEVGGNTTYSSYLLPEPIKPGAEIELNLELPQARPQKGKPQTYIVQFSSIKFGDLSEWQFQADCRLPNKVTRIRCQERK